MLLIPTTGVAQRASLQQIDALIASGQIDQARTALEQWKKNNRADAHSTFLAARLATRSADAEDAYLSVALSYPTSTYAPESLLRLGQARMAAGDTKQAGVYFRRLLADYPRSEHRATAEEWLGRTGKDNAATPVRARATIQVAAFRERSGARSVARQLENAGFEDVRLVTIPDNSLIRVRVGRFENSGAAAATVTKLKAGGFSAVVVFDAERETALRD